MVARALNRRSSYKKQYQAFVTKLYLARLETGLTQSEAAKRLQQPQQFISRIEHGQRRVDVIELLHIAKVYGKPITYFDPSHPPKPFP